MYWTYILRSLRSGKLYIGSTSDIDRRLNDHNRGKTISTKNRGPWTLIYSESFETKIMALNREKHLKSYKGGNALKRLINGD